MTLRERLVGIPENRISEELSCPHVIACFGESFRLFDE